MDTSNESITLLSTMSPKITNKLEPGQKRFRRVAGVSILALKRNFRRSSIYQKSVVTHNNEVLNLADDKSSTESCDSEKWNVLNETPIVISDSDEISDEEVEKIPLTTNNDNVRKCSLSDEKIDAIECWIAKINVENSTNSTVFSELSSIQGDTGENYIHEGLGQAVNSTFASPLCSKRLDELFQNNAKLKVLNESSVSCDDKRDALESSIDKLVIEDSFNTHNSTEKTRFIEQVNENQNVLTSPKSNAVSSSIPTKPDEKFQHNSLDSSRSNFNSLDTDEEYEDMENMLDKLYGNSWRAKKELVLPKTEPRKDKVKSIYPLKTNSERKPKVSLLYTNPYLDTFSTKPDNLLKKSQASILKTTTQTTPLLERLKQLCDSDTSSDSSPVKAVPKTKLSFNSNITDEDKDDKKEVNRVKLNFCPEITDDEENENTSKYFINKTPKSKLPEKLEDKIKKKNDGIGNKNYIKKGNMNGLMAPISHVKIGKKILESHKENIETPLKKKQNTKSRPRKQKTPFSNSSDSSDIALKNKDLNHSNSSCSTSEREWENEMSKIDHNISLVNGKYSFLASLSNAIPISHCDMSARIYRNNYKNFRDELAKKLFTLFNENIFDNSIPQDTPVEWNERLLNTAGQCHCKKIIRRCGKLERSARIVLSNKVLDSAERLRDTLVHEMCHAVTWIVNRVSDGHGKYWKSWAYKAMKTYPELPPISRCHNYVINTKYTYKCTGCGYSIGRHTKSLDIERKCCGYCLGKFEVLINKTTKKGTTKSVPATPKKEATGFALFVKENYGIYKTPEIKHGDVMKILGKKFQNMKVKT